MNANKMQSSATFCVRDGGMSIYSYLLVFALRNTGRILEELIIYFWGMENRMNGMIVKRGLDFSKGTFYIILSFEAF